MTTIGDMYGVLTGPGGAVALYLGHPKYLAARKRLEMQLRSEYFDLDEIPFQTELSPESERLFQEIKQIKEDVLLRRV